MRLKGDVVECFERGGEFVDVKVSEWMRGVVRRGMSIGKIDGEEKEGRMI